MPAGQAGAADGAELRACETELGRPGGEDSAADETDACCQDGQASPLTGAGYWAIAPAVALELLIVDPLLNRVTSSPDFFTPLPPPPLKLRQARSCSVIPRSALAAAAPAPAACMVPSQRFPRLIEELSFAQLLAFREILGTGKSPLWPDDGVAVDIGDGDLHPGPHRRRNRPDAGPTRRYPEVSAGAGTPPTDLPSGPSQRIDPRAMNRLPVTKMSRPSPLRSTRVEAWPWDQAGSMVRRAHCPSFPLLEPVDPVVVPCSGDDVVETVADVEDVRGRARDARRRSPAWAATRSASRAHRTISVAVEGPVPGARIGRRLEPSARRQDIGPRVAVDVAGAEGGGRRSDRRRAYSTRRP